MRDQPPVRCKDNVGEPGEVVVSAIENLPEIHVMSDGAEELPIFVDRQKYGNSGRGRLRLLSGKRTVHFHATPLKGVRGWRFLWQGQPESLDVFHLEVT